MVSRSLDADVHIVQAGGDGRLVVAHISCSGCSFRLVWYMPPNNGRDRRSFFRQLGPFLITPRRLVLMGDWNAILDPKADKGPSANSRAVLTLLSKTSLRISALRTVSERSTQTATWAHNSPSTSNSSYLDRVLVRKVDLNFTGCPSFRWLGYSNHKMVLVHIKLGNKVKISEDEYVSL